MSGSSAAGDDQGNSGVPSSAGKGTGKSGFRAPPGLELPLPMHEVQPSLAMHAVPLPGLVLPADSSYADAIQWTQWCTRCDAECLRLFAAVDSKSDARVMPDSNARISFKVMSKALFETILPQELGVFYRWGRQYCDAFVREAPPDTVSELPILFRQLAAWKFMRISGPDRGLFMALVEQHIPMYSPNDGAGLMLSASKSAPDAFPRRSKPRHPRNRGAP